MGKQVEKLSDRQIHNLIEGGQAVAVADGKGLTFTMSASQAARKTGSWVLRYRYGGRARELTLGQYPDKSLKQARIDAEKERVKVQDGADVARDRQKARVQRASAQTFRQLADDYMVKKFPDLAASTVKQRRHHIKDVILPRLGALPAREVETADVVALVEHVGKKSVNVADLVFTAVSEIFKHGIARHVVKANPCGGITVAAICGKVTPRKRLMLSEDELRIILPALKTVPAVGVANALVVKIQLATCVRLGELARAEWEHVDFDRAEWTIPDVNSKTGTGFVIPLVPAVVGWFKELQVLACGNRYVLPARQSRRGETFFEQRALNAALHKLVDELEVAGTPVRRFTPHDLRSTARSHLAALGVDVIVAERCLNHSLGGMLEIYDVHDYLTERRAALEKWTALIVACESGAPWNVVPLQRHAA